MKNVKTAAGALSAAVLMILAAGTAYAQFTSPTCAPPGCNPTVIQNVTVTSDPQIASINVTGDLKAGGMTQLGGTSLVLDAGYKNLLYGNVSGSSSAGSLLKLQTGTVDKVVVDLLGNGSFAGGLTTVGNVGIGTASPENGEGWDRVLDLYGASHAKLSLRTSGIDARILAHNTGWWSAPAGMIVGTGNGYPISLATVGISRLTVDTAGNVGIGTASPGATLDVNGQIKIAGGSPGAGKVLTSDASGLATWTTPATGGLTGTGTATYVPKWTSGTALGNSVIYDDGTNIGIGTTSPGAKLEVNGQVKITGGAPGAGKVLTSDASGLATWTTPAAGGVTSVTASAPLASSGGTTPNISFTGTLGIANGGTGSSSLTSNKFLWSNGSAIVASTYDNSSFATASHVHDAAAITSGFMATARLGSGTADSSTYLRGDGTWATPSSSGITGAGTATYLPKWTGSSTLANSMIYDNGSGIGIGTISPNNLIQVAGLINFDETSYNTYLGKSAGAGTGGYNVAVGQVALSLNSTGFSNTAVGVQAMRQNTTGYDNTVVGNQAFYANTSGHDNTAMGYYALYLNTTGNYNVGIGREALGYNGAGIGNTAVGTGAGDAAVLTGPTYSTFLGYDANSTVAAPNNSTAIGNGATVTASNQVVIGNGSVTQTLLNGNVGIGTASPGAKLHVNGAAAGSAPNIQTTGDVLVGSGGSLFFDGNYSYASGNYIRPIAANTQQFVTAGVERMRIDSSGRVGIGTASPSYKLDVRGTSTTGPIAYIANSDTGANSNGLFASSAGTAPGVYGASNGGNGVYGYTTGSGAGVYGANSSNIGVYGNGNTGVYGTGAYGVYGVGSSYGLYTPSNSYIGGILTLGTYMNVGVGVSAGYYQDSANGAYRALNVSNAGYYFQNYGGTATTMYVGLAGTYAGKVGIGTAAPPYMLTVAGDIYAAGGWLRTAGSSGWYNESYGGGWYMVDSTWIRSYNSKSVLIGGGQMRIGSGAYTAVAGDIGASREAAPTTGVIYLGNSSVHYLYYDGGTFHFRGGNIVSDDGSFSPTSDRRLKEDIASLDGTSSLDLVEKLNPVTFRWKKTEKNPDPDRGLQYGFVAQDVQEVMPSLVHADAEGTLNLNYDGLIAPTVKAVQEQQAEIQSLREQVQELQKRLDELK